LLVYIDTSANMVPLFIAYLYV